jgi:hypothetical protein
MSDDDLTWAVEASAAQIALAWMVGQWERSNDRQNMPLDRQIMDFSSYALAEVCLSYPILGEATEEIRWLTYFKGLIAADTHPRDQMLNAIAAVRRRRADVAGNRSANWADALEDHRPYEIDPVSRADALAAINRALSEARENGRL